ncbi:DUF551 domain-containing protein [Acinetobacter sp. WU_MDCI_Axc73]|nr:DUF551 domain-containing protein [Acinetobacter sp. WU_MDCI_Axc73]
MIDLEKEYQEFENNWLLMGASFKNFYLGEDKMYHLKDGANNLTNTEKTLSLSCINTSLAFWLTQARAKQAEIDSLKAENIELQKKYQHADTQLSDIDGHYTLLKKEVEALKAKLEQSKKVWISVDFMLPDEGEKVLLAIGDEQTVAEKCRVFGFIDSIDREALRTDLITHWMSLPEPPSKEAQGDGDE